MAKTKKQRKPVSITSTLILCGIAALFTAIIVFAAVHILLEALIWAGATFIVAIVTISTLTLASKPDQHAPDEPRLK
jgi:hypothetical protein